MCHMGQQKFTLHCPFDLPVRYHRGEVFENVHYIQVRLKTCHNTDVTLVASSGSRGL